MCTSMSPYSPFVFFPEVPLCLPPTPFLHLLLYLFVARGSNGSTERCFKGDQRDNEKDSFIYCTNCFQDDKEGTVWVQWK